MSLSQTILLAIKSRSTLLNGIVAYYKFDSSNSNDSVGSLNGADTSITYGAQKIGNGASATNGLITNTNSAFNLTQASVSCWVKSAGFGTGYRTIVKCGDMYSLFAKDNVLILYDWGGTADRSTGVNIADNAWHHLVLTFDSGVTNGSKIYLDGSLSLTFTATAGSYVAMKMFSDGIGSQNAACAIDEVGFWNRVLTSTEVTSLHAAGAGLQHPF